MFRFREVSFRSLVSIAVLLSMAAVDAHAQSKSIHAFEAGYISGDPSGGSLGEGPMVSYFRDFEFGSRISLGVGAGLGVVRKTTFARPDLTRTAWVVPLTGRVQWSLLGRGTTPFVELGAGLYYTHAEASSERKSAVRPGVSGAIGLAHPLTPTLTLGAKAGIHSVRPDAGLRGASNDFGMGVYKLELRWRR